MDKKIAVIENNILATNGIRSRLMEALKEEGYQVTILTTGNKEELDVAGGRGFHIIDVGASVQHVGGIIRYIRQLRKELKTLQPDICLTFTIRPAIWGNMVTRWLKIPTISNITGIGPLFERNNLAYRGARFLYKFVLQKTQRIFFQNKDDLDIFIEKGFAKKNTVRLIPGSGIDYHYYAPTPKGRKDDQFIFLFISRLVKDKGILEFVKAAGILKDQIPRAAFYVLGPVWRQNLKDNTVTEQEIKCWEQKGWIQYLGGANDVRPFIADADCIVLPSYREGMSNVLLEASSMEKPCIASNVTGCKEIVEDGVTGYLCAVRDAESLAGKMKEMFYLPEKELLEMGMRARKKVVKEFDKRIVIDAYLKEIEEILNTHE